MVTVAIDARLADGEPGGVQQTIFGLASGLGTLDDRGDSYQFLVNADHRWLTPALRGPCRALVVRSEARSAPKSQAWKALRYLKESRGHILPASDGTVEAAGVDVIHFMLQRGFRTRLPNLYQPHDLQHLEHPEWFHPLQRTYRRLSYRAMARQASRLVVMTRSARAPTAEKLAVPESKTIVVPWGSVMSLYGDTVLPRDALESLGVPERFMLYPAQTWPHKNHIRLVEAVALLRHRHGLSVCVVLTGRRNAYWSDIENEIRRLGVEDLVISLGWVDTQLLRTLYQSADALIFPSLFEGWGLPIVEALDVGLPVLCSDVTPLSEIALEAAVKFDPLDPAAIADAIRAAWSDPALRDRLSAAGRYRSRVFSWTSTAALFRAHYRDVLGLPPIGDDASLLKAPAPV